MERDRDTTLVEAAAMRPVSGRYEMCRSWQVIALAGLTWALSLPLFEPFSWWPLGYVVFVPWLVGVYAARRTGLVHLTSCLLGVAYFLTHLRWLGTTSIAGYVAAAIYLAIYFPLAFGAMRYLLGRRRIPAIILFPIVWTAVELLRSRGPLAFPWFLLGHSQIRILSLIQIADLAGAFGVSFVLAVANGWFADLVLGLVPVLRGCVRSPGRVPISPGEGINPHFEARKGDRQRRNGDCPWAFRGLFTHPLKGGPPRLSRLTLISGLVPVLLLAGTAAYGHYRLGSQITEAGPRIAVVQGDFLLEAVRGAHGVSDSDKMRAYLRLMEQASETSPDMIVLPETPWSMILNQEVLAVEPGWAVFQKFFGDRAARYGCFITVGGMSEEPQPPQSYPAAHRYNSAFVYGPGDTKPARYDKIHLVPFGECVPFRHTKGLFWLYRFLNDGWFNPWGSGGFEYSLTAGREFTTFVMKTRSLDPQAFRFGITICYEDVIPQVFRGFVAHGSDGKQADFMLNISNDGWFGRGSQQPQHLVNCAFRAIENRVAVARAANTGVSGFIDPDGSWHDLMSDPDHRPQAGGIGYRVAPLRIDRRLSFYTRHSDLFALLCGFLTLTGLADAAIHKLRKKHHDEQASQ